jgi:hypothetical protein
MGLIESKIRKIFVLFTWPDRRVVFGRIRRFAGATRSERLFKRLLLIKNIRLRVGAAVVIDDDDNVSTGLCC